MERGLLWLPLLGVFIWLAWSGRNEYQKLEAYKQWAVGFERAKYDIYSVLGQQGETLTWGTPTRNGPVNLNSLSLKDVQAIQLLVDGQPADLTAPPPKGKAALEFARQGQPAVQIPFTEPALAARWGQFLQTQLSTVT